MPAALPETACGGSTLQALRSTTAVPLRQQPPWCASCKLMRPSSLPKRFASKSSSTALRRTSNGPGPVVVQPYQPRLAEGMIRCYFAQDQVVGFCQQYPRGLLDELEAEARQR